MKTRQARRRYEVSKPDGVVRDAMFKCSWCQKVLPATSFYKRKNTKTGHYSYCKACAASPKRKAAVVKYGAAKYSRRDELMMSGKKKCPHCSRILPLDDFYKDPRKPTGRYSYCKLCHKSKTSGAYILTKAISCGCCGFIPIHSCQLQVDHIDGNNNNDNRDNLRTLCSNCHALKTYKPSLFSQFWHDRE